MLDNNQNALPLIVPVEPQGWLVTLLACGIGLLWFALGTLILFLLFLPIPPQQSWLMVFIGVIGMVIGFALSIVILSPMLSWVARTGTLTIYRDGMTIQTGTQTVSFTWYKPIYARRWQAGFVDEDNVVYENMYDVWQFKQETAQIIISRRRKHTSRKLLSEYIAGRKKIPVEERGLLISRKAGKVWNLIERLGDLRFVT